MSTTEDLHEVEKRLRERQGPFEGARFNVDGQPSPDQVRDLQGSLSQFHSGADVTVEVQPGWGSSTVVVSVTPKTDNPS